MLSHSPEQDEMDRVLHALADPSRRVIVERLSNGPASVSELARPLPMSLPAVIQHVQVLEASGLVRSKKVGRVRTCRMEPAALRPVERWIGARRASGGGRLDRLGEYLEETADESPK
jgi:DNA-binding transcriptional ArsR family regulator